MLRLRIAALVVVVLSALAPAARAASPSAGTLDDLHLSLTYTGGPFTGGNPTNNVPGATGPDCSAVPNTCDDYTVTVNMSPLYLAAHPGYTVRVSVAYST